MKKNDSSMQEIPIKQVKESGKNYRRIFEKKAMAELTESVAARGVLQPILVRPVGKSFEVVAGHRRLRAAIAAKLKTIPAIAKKMDEAEALELQLIENGQREDPNPIEEAQGYDRLIRLGKYTKETLAEKLNCAPIHILKRIKLLDLPPEIKKLLAIGELGIGHGLLLTRLRHKHEKLDMLKAIRARNMSIKEVAEEMHNINRTMAKAVFDITECKACHFLSSNQAELFVELKKSDQCTDGTCYTKKTHAHYKVTLKAKKAEGFQVFEDEKTIDAMLNDGKKTVEIKPTGANQGWNYHIPKRYKNKCMKCKDSHAWYLYIHTRQWNNVKVVSFGEICLNTACLNKMNKLNQPSSGKAEPNVHNQHFKGRECRDRFLLSQVPGQEMAVPTLSKRLTIYHLCKEGMGLEFLNEEARTILKVSEGDIYLPGQEIYNKILNIPDEQLDEALKLILHAKAAADTSTDVLLMMAPEAGIDVGAEFKIDEAWLKTKTKPQLVMLNSELGLGLELSATAKKGKLIEAILGENITGMIPLEMAKLFNTEVKE